ncbi:MAG: glycosyltransferase family 39 protein [Proteobacteria bacterium]|nr:glycosyltransferase family 39 protein [Pseudomonadota bacterium]
MNSLPSSLLRMSAGLAMISALALVAGTVLVPGMAPDRFAASGLQPMHLWALSVLAVALYVFGYSVRRGAPVFGLLAATLILGGGAQLYLTDPLWFPGLKLRPGGPVDWLMVAVLAAEALVAIVATVSLGPGRIAALASARLGSGNVLLFMALTTAFAVPILGYLGHGSLLSYLAHVAIGGALIATHLAILFAMTQVRTPMTGVTRISPIVPAVLTVIASAALSWFAFERMPHVEDEVAYLFQARTFASGALTLPAPPEAAWPGLDYYLIEVQDGRWFSSTQPGWPAFLALGILAGVPWLLNPLLAGLSVLLAYDITRRRAGTDAGDLVALLMATSPWLLSAAASLMPHTMTLALILFAWWLILRSEDTGKRSARAMVIAGLAMGLIFAARPMDGLVIGILTGLWIVTGRRQPWLRAIQYSAGCIAAVMVFLAYNALITGHPLLMPLSDYINRTWGPGANAYGFGPDIGPPGGWLALDLWVGHSPLEAVLNTINSIVSLQFEMLGWPIGSLALLFAYLIWQRKGGFDLAMILVAAVVIVVMALYWYGDTYHLGPRYWFIAAFPFFYLSARGCEALCARVARRDGAECLRLDAAVAVCCLFGILVFMPWRGVAKFHDYNGFYSLFRTEEARGTFGNDIVLFTEVGDPGSALMLNDLNLAGSGPIYLRDTGTMDLEALKQAFPGRRILHYTPDWVRPGARRR